MLQLSCLYWLFLIFKDFCFCVLFQAAKKIYENLLGDGDNATALAHIQVCEIVCLICSIVVLDTLKISKYSLQSEL